MFGMLLSSCARDIPKTSAGICKGLKGAVDKHAETLYEFYPETPDEVLLSGVAVIRGYDAGCEKGKS